MTQTARAPEQCEEHDVDGLLSPSLLSTVHCNSRKNIEIDVADTTKSGTGRVQKIQMNLITADRVQVSPSLNLIRGPCHFPKILGQKGKKKKLRLLHGPPIRMSLFVTEIQIETEDSE